MRRFAVVVALPRLESYHFLQARQYFGVFDRIRQTHDSVGRLASNRNATPFGDEVVNSPDTNALIIRERAAKPSRFLLCGFLKIR
jgi:hypothetical protein